MRNTFKVYERLKREQHIDTLFRSGKAFSVFPLRVIYFAVKRPSEADSPVLAGFSVAKKKFNSSVHRHKIRRLMIEAWRLNKHSLYLEIPPELQLHIFVVFTDTKIPEYETVLTGMLQGIEKLVKNCPKEPDQIAQNKTAKH